jgi:RNA polymerase sigma-70 factor (ECF subfamily)
MLYWFGMGATGNTTAAIQGYLDELAGLRGDSPADPVVRSLLTASAGRLHQLCANLLYRSYPRLARAPLNLQSEEMLSAVVERLMKSLRQAHPGNIRQFFKIANQHMRWELNDLARRLDERTPLIALGEVEPASPQSTASQLSPIARRIFQVIDQLPEDEREVFELVRIQGLTHREAAECLGVAERTVERRLNRGLLLLRQQLGEISAVEVPPPES